MSIVMLTVWPIVHGCLFFAGRDHVYGGLPSLIDGGYNEGVVNLFLS